MARECPSKEDRGGADGSCRKCGEDGHFARECPNVADAPRTCRNCDAEDHVARDCPLPRDISRVKCNNCDEMGHVGRDCSKPRDYTRVKCNNCGESEYIFCSWPVSMSTLTSTQWATLRCAARRHQRNMRTLEVGQPVTLSCLMLDWVMPDGGLPLVVGRWRSPT
jgi:hypothetical protein